LPTNIHVKNHNINDTKCIIPIIFYFPPKNPEDLKPEILLLPYFELNLDAKEEEPFFEENLS
jgi:hypothetical protein